MYGWKGRRSCLTESDSRCRLLFRLLRFVLQRHEPGLYLRTESGPLQDLLRLLMQIRLTAGGNMRSGNRCVTDRIFCKTGLLYSALRRAGADFSKGKIVLLCIYEPCPQGLCVIL